MHKTTVSVRNKDGWDNALVFGSLELFIGKVKAVHVDEQRLDKKGNIYGLKWNYSNQQNANRKRGYLEIYQKSFRK